MTALKLELLRLRTTARLLHTTAHPDDEDGGMLTLESRGRGATTELLTLTRGEGGQNRMGSNLLDELGALRTLELLASDNYYATSQRFTRAVDFGFSKTADESFEKWGRHGPVLADLVLVIRTFRPDVIVSRFQGSPRDGHGHHQAAAIFTRKAFRVAADPTMFPEQIASGLAPWQAKKLYVDNLAPGESYSLAIDTGAFDPALGMSYQQFAQEGLRHQLSQGTANFKMRAGLCTYKLVDSVLPFRAAVPPSNGSQKSADAHEQDFFDGIDTSLPGLAARLGSEQTKLPELRQQLTDIAAFIAEADNAASHDPNAALPPLLKAYELLKTAIAHVEAAQLTPVARQDMLVNLATKEDQCVQAIRLASDVRIKATLDESAAGPNSSGTVVPGESFSFTAHVELPAAPAVVSNIEPVLPAGWSYQFLPQQVKGGLVGDLRLSSQQNKIGFAGEEPPQATAATFIVTVPRDAEYTRPHYHRDSPAQTLYTIDNEEFATLPFTPPPVKVKVVCRFRKTPVEFEQWVEADAGASNQCRQRPIAVVPAASATIEPAVQVVPQSRREAVPFVVTVRSSLAQLPGAVLRVHAPAGWRVEPESVEVDLSSRNAKRAYGFRLIKDGAMPGCYRLNATLSFRGKEYDQGISAVTRDDRRSRHGSPAAPDAGVEACIGLAGVKNIGAIYHYQTAAEDVHLIDVAVPRNLAVGYIIGAGDGIPDVLRQVGMNVTTISAEELTQDDLSRYGTIIIGIRAYDVRADVRQYNARLLDFVRRGGTLIAQYNTGVADFNSGRYTPFPAELGRERVTDERSPVQMLVPDDKIFSTPNKITADDFNGWIQERGLYFMHSWDGPWEPLLAMSDRGEQPLKGGLLRCRYGRGTYIYTGLSFFRQLPEGVPGAVRLYVNLIAAGHNS